MHCGRFSGGEFSDRDGRSGQSSNPGDRCTADTERVTTDSSDAFGRMDLLTVVMHEMGHILGHGHGAEDGVMGDTLDVGTRYLVAWDQAIDELFG